MAVPSRAAGAGGVRHPDDRIALRRTTRQAFPSFAGFGTAGGEAGPQRPSPASGSPRCSLPPRTAGRPGAWSGCPGRYAAADIAPQAKPSWIGAVNLARASALVAIGRVEDAHAILHIYLAEAAVDDPGRISATALAARVAYLLGHHGEAEAILQRELMSDVRWQPAALAAVHVELATARLMSADFAGAREAAEQALSLAPSSEQPTVAGAAAVITLSSAASGDIEVALAHGNNAATLVDSLSDGELAVSLEVGVWLGWAEMFLERVDSAKRHLERCLRIARRGAHQHLLTHLLVGWGSVLKIKGDLAGATEAFDEAREAAERVGSAELTTMATAMECRAATWRGDMKAAQRLGAEAVAMAAERSNWFASVAAALYAQALLAAGNPTGCVDAILEAGGGPDLPGFDPASRCDWWEVAVTAALLEGDLATARDLTIGRLHAPACCPSKARRASHYSAKHGSSSRRASRVRRAGTPSRPPRTSRPSASGSRRPGRKHLEGVATGRAGERTRAVQLLTEAESVFAECRAARLRAEARGELRRFGRRVATIAAGGSSRRTDGSPLGSLSARERQVATLVAAGKTNRQIATELVVSEKTVESHLGHIFVKLEVSSRASVATVVAQDQPDPLYVP